MGAHWLLAVSHCALILWGKQHIGLASGCHSAAEVPWKFVMVHLDHICELWSLLGQWSSFASLGPGGMCVGVVVGLHQPAVLVFGGLVCCPVGLCKLCCPHALSVVGLPSLPFHLLLGIRAMFLWINCPFTDH